MWPSPQKKKKKRKTKRIAEKLEKTGRFRLNLSKNTQKKKNNWKTIRSLFSRPIGCQGVWSARRGFRVRSRLPWDWLRCARIAVQRSMASQFQLRAAWGKEPPLFFFFSPPAPTGRANSTVWTFLPLRKFGFGFGDTHLGFEEKKNKKNSASSEGEAVTRVSAAALMF